MFYFNCLHLSSVQCASFGRFFCFGLAFGKTHINAFAAQIVFPQIGIFRIHRTCVSRARAQSSANEFDRWRESIYFIFIFVRFWIGLWMMVRCYSVGAHSTHWNVEIKSSMFVNGKLFYIAPICNFWWQAITFPCDLVQTKWIRRERALIHSGEMFCWRANREKYFLQFFNSTRNRFHWLLTECRWLRCRQNVEQSCSMLSLTS